MLKKQKSRDITIRLDSTDELLKREVKKFGGNAGHIILPSKHIGKYALIILSKTEVKDTANVLKKEK